MAWKSGNHHLVQLLHLLIPFLLAADSTCTASEIVLHRVVFQTVVLSDGATVQCYGTCDLDPQDKFEKQPNFNVSRCEGKRLRFGCDDHAVMKIHLANLGQMNPAFEICHQREPIGCIKNVADALEKKCLGVSRCTFDVTNEPLSDICGFVQYLFLDIRFICVAQPRAGSESPTKTKPAVFTSTMATEDPTMAPTQAVVLDARLPSTKDGGMFWLLTAYSWLMDKKFIKVLFKFVDSANGTHLALAIILSVFIGLVLSLCFVLDHCRRQRLNRVRKKAIGSSKNENEGSFVDCEPWENIEMKELVAVDYWQANDTAPLTDTDLIYEMEYSDSEARESSTLLRSKKEEPQRNHAAATASYLPPPPKELLDSPEDLVTRQIPPPVGFGSIVAINKTEELVPCVLITNPSSVATKTDGQPSVVRLLPSGHGVVCETHGTSRGSGSRARGRVNMPTSEGLSRKFPSDFNDRANMRPMTRKHSQGALFNPLPAVSPPQQRLRSNSSRWEEMLSCQQLNQTRVAAERPGRYEQSSLPTSPSSHAKHPISGRLSLFDPRRTPHADANAQSDTSELTMRSPATQQRPPRKGHLHVVRAHANPPKPLVPGQELQHMNSPVSGYRFPTQKAWASTNSGTAADAASTKSALPYSAKVFTVPRHKCGSGHGHTCICIPVRTPAGSFTCACLEKAKSGYKDCCTTACDTSKVIQKKPYSAQRACSPAIIERASSAPARSSQHLPENNSDRKMNPAKETTGSSNSTDSRSVGVEESGYHSHGTGTDSLCSSARSTDQEDALMFQPASQADVRVVNAHSIRSKVLRSREKLGRKDLKLFPETIPTRTLNRTERRSRGLVDAGPSESSLDDDCGQSPGTMIGRTKSLAKKKGDSSPLSKTASDHDDLSANTINDGQAFDILNMTLVRSDQQKSSRKESRTDVRAKPLNSSKTL